MIRITQSSSLPCQPSLWCNLPLSSLKLNSLGQSTLLTSLPMPSSPQLLLFSLRTLLPHSHVRTSQTYSGALLKLREAMGHVLTILMGYVINPTNK